MWRQNSFLILKYHFTVREYQSEPQNETQHFVYRARASDLYERETITQALR